MYDTLLFLHVIAAFAVFVTVATYSAVALGGYADRPALTVANLCWDIGGIGAFVFGIWLALNVDDYEVWDLWVLAALVLFAIATELGRRARVGFEAGTGAASAEARQAAVMHWLRTAVVIGILLLMVYKPGA